MNDNRTKKAGLDAAAVRLLMMAQMDMFSAACLMKDGKKADAARREAHELLDATLDKMQAMIAEAMK